MDYLEDADFFEGEMRCGAKAGKTGAKKGADAVGVDGGWMRE